MQYIIRLEWFIILVLLQVPVQINGKTKAVIEISADATKEEALEAGKAAIADKLTGNVIKEIYVPKKIINIVMK